MTFRVFLLLKSIIFRCPNSGDENRGASTHLLWKEKYWLRKGMHTKCDEWWGVEEDEDDDEEAAAAAR